MAWPVRAAPSLSAPVAARHGSKLSGCDKSGPAIPHPRWRLNTVAARFHLLFGQAEATLKYDGLAPSAVGLYQFNVVVPNVTPSDAVPVTFTLAGVAGTQTLHIAVGN